MNSNLTRAVSAALVAFGGVAPALAQLDSDGFCIDPNNTKPYSDVFIFNLQRNSLFGATIGSEGTVAYASYCNNGGPIRGRIGFTLGTLGSIQDNDPNQAGAFVDSLGRPLHDENLRLTLGTNFVDTVGSQYGLAYAGPLLTPASGGNSFARVYVRQTTAAGAITTTNYLFGQNGFNLFFTGRGGRYIYSQTKVDGTDANNSVDVRLVIDVLGDSARLGWRLTNNLTTTDTVGLGLYFGQVVNLLEENTGSQFVNYGGASNGTTTVYMTIPGRKPLTVQERFNSTGLSPAGEPGGATVGVPPYINFSMNQTAGFGLQVVNNPSALTSFDPTSGADQTPVDEFVLGEAPFLISGRYDTTDPQFGDFIFNAVGNGNNDAAAVFGDPAFAQKWEPTVTVARGGFRDITSYYRATNFDSSYSQQFAGYTAVIDTPKAISTNPATITTDAPFRTNPFTLRVYVDNTGGFSNVDTSVPMQSVQVVLNLPAGMFDPATGSRTVTKNISSVNPSEIGAVDFQVAIDPNLFGAQTYTATITPQPGFQAKTITGTINVATAPRLQIRQNANLVSPPWQFADSTWEQVLGLQLNTEFQAYAWDALRQQYVTQTAAERTRGTWIISRDELGYKVLGGTPRQPNDEFPDPNNYDVAQNGGAPLVRLRRGWNLVGNPYNYAFPLGQLVGVPVGTSGGASIAFSDLVNLGYTNGAFAYYDPSNKQYKFIPGLANSRLQPNFGYWIYANSDFDLQFPALYELFIRSAAPTDPSQRYDRWELQLSAQSATATDSDNFAGIVPDADEARKLSFRKPPMPVSAARDDVLSCSVVGDGGVPMAQSLRASQGAQAFTFNVFSKNGGPVTVSWPNLKALPSNLSVVIVDPAKKKSFNARNASGYTITAKAGQSYPLNVSVTPMGVPPQRITAATYSLVKVGTGKQLKVNFSTSGRGSATLKVFRGQTLVGTIANDMDIVAGANSATWTMLGLDGQPLANGVYTVAIEATGETGTKATRQLAVTIRR